MVAEMLESSSGEEFQSRAGDIFCCWSKDAISALISVVTCSLLAPAGLRVGPSHVAIACPLKESNDPNVWFESTSLCQRPCLVRGRRVSGCQVHPIADRAADYLRSGGAVEVYRLTPINVLTHEAALDLARDLRWFVDAEFEYDAASAVFSGTRILKSIDFVLPFWRARRSSVFCSQMIAAELQAEGLMNRDQPQRYSPGRLMRQLVRQGVYFRSDSLRLRGGKG